MPSQKKTTNYTLPTKPELEDAYQALWATLQNKLGPYFSDYGQLIEKGSPLNNQYQQLKSNISQHIPSNADFRSPQRMSEWAQAAALNAPMGLTLKGAPPTKFSRAHKLAQKNAALPIEQGGLGLPPNNTAMDRARAMGFDMDAYHGTTANIEQFDPERSSSAAAFGPGVYTTESAKDASGWLKSKDGGNVIPLLINESSFLKAREMDTKTKGILENFLGRELNDGPPPLFSLERRGGSVSEGAMNAGFGGVEHFGTSRTPTKNNVILDASKIRSRFAAFDPLKKDSANILASILGATTLAGMYGKEQEQPSTLRSVMEKKLKK